MIEIKKINMEKSIETKDGVMLEPHYYDINGDEIVPVKGEKYLFRNEVKIFPFIK